MDRSCTWCASLGAQLHVIFLFEILCTLASHHKICIAKKKDCFRRIISLNFKIEYFFFVLAYTVSSSIILMKMVSILMKMVSMSVCLDEHSYTPTIWYCIHRIVLYFRLSGRRVCRWLQSGACTGNVKCAKCPLFGQVVVWTLNWRATWL
jgi:hypothetical protein